MTTGDGVVFFPVPSWPNVLLICKSKTPGPLTVIVRKLRLQLRQARTTDAIYALLAQTAPPSAA